MVNRAAVLARNRVCSSGSRVASAVSASPGMKCSPSRPGLRHQLLTQNSLRKDLEPVAPGPKHDRHGGGHRQDK